MKTRYEMGLGKLEFASSQVSVMQNQLTDLRPQLLGEYLKPIVVNVLFFIFFSLYTYQFLIQVKNIL